MNIKIMINDKLLFFMGQTVVIKEGLCMSNKTYRALDVAKYVVNYVNNEGKPITHLQIQKILYYIQAQFLVEKSKPLFLEPIEAWRHGPVVSSVYSYYRRYTNMAIFSKEQPSVTFTTNEQKIMNKVIDKYKEVNGWDLVNKTHQESPWKDVYRNGQGMNCEIPLYSIKKYFSKVMC